MTLPRETRDDPPPGDTSDDALLRAFAAGRPHAFDLLVARHGPRVRGYLERMVPGQGLADDLTQEVFVALLERGPFGPGEPRLEVWLLHVARNRALDAMRRRSVRRRAVEAMRGGVGRLAALLGRSPAPPDRVLESEEFAAALEEALAGLPEPQRSAFLLRERDGFDYREIGAVMGCSPKTVSSRLHRARLTLREALREVSPGHVDPRDGGDGHGR